MYKSTVTPNLASGVTFKFHVTPNFQNRYLNRSKNVKTRHFNFFTKLILLMVIHPHTHPHTHKRKHRSRLSKNNHPK